MNVLLATADSTLAAQFQAELESMGFTVLEAADGSDALVAAGNSNPKLMLLDDTLPVFDGLTLAAMLRADPDLPAEVPLLLLAARDVEPHALDAAGVDAVFPKAHGAADLRERVTDLLARSGLLE